MQTKFTHRGVFGFVPVYLADIDSDSPALHPVYPFTEWLIYVSAWIFDTLGAEMYPIKTKGELEQPFEMDIG